MSEAGGGVERKPEAPRGGGELAIEGRHLGHRAGVQERGGQMQRIHRAQPPIQCQGVVDDVVVDGVEVHPADDGVDVLVRSAATIHGRVELDLEKPGGEQSGACANSDSTAAASGSLLSSLYAAEVSRYITGPPPRMSSSICSVVQSRIGVLIRGHSALCCRAQGTGREPAGAMVGLDR